jgi:hypothetical protein
MVGIGSIWLRIGTGGGLMWRRWWTSGFHKMLGSSRVAAQLAASQEELSSMSEWVSECAQYAFQFWVSFISGKRNGAKFYDSFGQCVIVHNVKLHAWWLPIYSSIFGYSELSLFAISSTSYELCHPLLFIITTFMHEPVGLIFPYQIGYLYLTLSHFFWLVRNMFKTIFKCRIFHSVRKIKIMFP